MLSNHTLHIFTHLRYEIIYVELRLKGSCNAYVRALTPLCQSTLHISTLPETRSSHNSGLIIVCTLTPVLEVPSILALRLLYYVLIHNSNMCRSLHTYIVPRSNHILDQRGSKALALGLVKKTHTHTSKTSTVS